MIRFRIQTLRQKTFIFVLVPTFLFLSAVGWGSFIFAKRTLLTQWSETANANLQKAAHLVDMRLERPKNLLLRLKDTSGTGMAHLTLSYTLEQLRKLDGVIDVKMDWSSPLSGKIGMMGPSGGHHSTDPLLITYPKYIWENDKSSVSLLSNIVDSKNDINGSLEVFVNVSDLVQQIAKSDWWKSNRAMLIDAQGNIIAHSTGGGDIPSHLSERQFGEKDSLEKRTLAEIQKKTHGTIFGPGNPPHEISGFYRLSDAPWFMAVIAPGNTVLQPILKFSFYYSLLFATAIIIIIVFILSMTTKMTSSIQKLSVAAEDLANGVFGPSLPVQTHDEIGELTKNFNSMTTQLKQGMELQKAMEIAREVQQNFLPSARYSSDSIEIYGACRYCQETGGDFFDLVQNTGSPVRVGAIVGDVVGHGIGAALLMASVRAMVRARNEQPGTLAEIIADVNTVLCRDTAASSNFATLFYLAIEPETRTLEWVRAGHDPGFLLYPARQKCLELSGKGVALGIDGNLKYESNRIDISAEPHLVVIGSDGAWEAENARGERFGKPRLMEILANNSSDTAEMVIKEINAEIDAFLDGVPPQDDITFVVIKIDGEKIHTNGSNAVR